MKLFVLILLLCTGTVRGTKGREFVAAFFEHFRTDHFPQIFFIILSDVNTTVHIESVGFGISEDVFVKGMVEYKYTTSENNYYQGNLDVTDMTFYITSTEDITVYCYNYMVTRGDGYVALPVPSLSTHYLVVSHTDDDTSDLAISLLYTGTTHTVFLIIATEDTTTVDVKVKMKGDNMAGGCANGSLHDGDKRVFELNKHQIVGAYCDDDITGTEILSDKPVAVLSGHNYKRFPGGVSDHLVEMLVPVQSFGRSFFLPESPAEENKAMYRVVGSEAATNIRSPSGLAFSVNKGEPYDIDVNSTTGPMYIEADKPVLVAQFMTKKASMALVPPVSLYSHSYDVSRSILHGGTAELKDVYVTVVAPTDKVLGLRPEIFPQFEVIKGTCFAFATVALNVSFYRLSHVDDVQFGVMTYITAFFKGVFTHAAGYNMTDYIAKTDCPVSSSICSDGTPYPCSCTEGYFDYQCPDTSLGCDAMPCQYESTCIDHNTFYHCECVSGSGGASCEIDTFDHCNENSCINGSCVDEIDGYSCNCTAGFQGEFCDIDIDECATNPCVHGSCEDNVNNYTCVCDPGYVDRDCDTEVNECESNPCQNGGTCTDFLLFYNCTCEPGLDGHQCEINTDPCHSAPCDNNGTCTQTTDGFNCSCSPGTEGLNCEIDIDECSSSPCDNGGECVNENNAFSCNCAQGFTGSICESYTNPCDSAPCENNGTCTQTTDGFNCSCSPGTEGLICEIDIDECSSSPCDNGGECVNENNAFSCNCAQGFTGSICESYTNTCDSAPCKNNGTCTQTPEGFNCSCSPGTEGYSCETDINECASSPCQNDGTCIDNINSFECLCHSDYGGVLCHLILSCGCKCYSHNLTDDELAARLQWLRSLLLLDHSTLSKSIRKKISVLDNRPLSMGIGYSGVLFLTLSMGLIVMFDMTGIRRMGTYTPRQSEEGNTGQVSGANNQRPISQSNLSDTQS